jgi:hypothetical protein
MKTESLKLRRLKSPIVGGRDRRTRITNGPSLYDPDGVP